MSHAAKRASNAQSKSRRTTDWSVYIDWGIYIGMAIVWDLLNIFRLDDQGRLVEEWVRTDYRSFLRQLGAQGK